MLLTRGLLDWEGFGGGLQLGSLGGGGLEVGGGLTVGFTGTIGFSVSVEGTGGHTLFSNLTTEPGLSSTASLAWPAASPPSSHIFLRLEMEPVLLLLSLSSSSSSSMLCLLTDLKLAFAFVRSSLFSGASMIRSLLLLGFVFTFLSWDLKSTLPDSDSSSFDSGLRLVGWA